MTTDKGLKKAVNGQPAYRLPSNFTYRMMKQIHEEARAANGVRSAGPSSC